MLLPFFCREKTRQRRRPSGWDRWQWCLTLGCPELFLKSLVIGWVHIEQYSQHTWTWSFVLIWQFFMRLPAEISFSYTSFLIYLLQHMSNTICHLIWYWPWDIPQAPTYYVLFSVMSARMKMVNSVILFTMQPFSIKLFQPCWSTILPWHAMQPGRCGHARLSDRQFWTHVSLVYVSYSQHIEYLGWCVHLNHILRNVWVCSMTSLDWWIRTKLAYLASIAVGNVHYSRPLAL